MPRRKGVLSLKTLCFEEFERYVFSFMHHVVINTQNMEKELNLFGKFLFCGVPDSLLENLVKHYVQALENFEKHLFSRHDYEEIVSPTDENVECYVLTAHPRYENEEVVERFDPFNYQISSPTHQSSLDLYELQEEELEAKYEKVLDHLISFVPFLKPKKLNLSCGSCRVHLFLNLSLVNFSSLEVLKYWDRKLMEPSYFHSCDREDREKGDEIISRFFLSSSNLTCFIMHCYCSDDIIFSLTENCKAIKEIDVWDSSFVTDSCIVNLLSCQELQKVNFEGTDLSPKGFFELIFGQNRLIKLVDMGTFSKFEQVLDLLENSSVVPSQIKFLKYRLFNPKYLPLVIENFPSLISFELQSFADDVLDVSYVSKLRKLECFRMSEHNTTQDNIYNFRDFLSHQGSLITSLVLNGQSQLHCSVFDIAVLCPNIVNLAVAVNYWVHDEIDRSMVQLKQKLFQKLQHLYIGYHLPRSVFKFIVSTAHNITSLTVRAENLEDEFFASILRVNPLKKLKLICLCDPSSISVETLKFIITNLEQIECLKILKRGLQEDALKSLQEFISVNNYDVTLC